MITKISVVAKGLKSGPVPQVFRWSGWINTTYQDQI